MRGSACCQNTHNISCSCHVIRVRIKITLSSQVQPQSLEEKLTTKVTYCGLHSKFFLYCSYRPTACLDRSTLIPPKQHLINWFVYQIDMLCYELKSWLLVFLFWIVVSNLGLKIPAQLRTPKVSHVCIYTEELTSLWSSLSVTFISDVNLKFKIFCFSYFELLSCSSCVYVYPYQPCCLAFQILVSG